MATALFLLACVLFMACDRNWLPGVFRRNRSTLMPALGILVLLSMAVHAWCLGVWAGHTRIHKEDTHGRATGVFEKAERDTGEP